jgi:hypothetical protein
MRQVVLDTDVASLIIKQQLPATLLRELVGAQAGITFVTLGELTRRIPLRLDIDESSAPTNRYGRTSSTTASAKPASAPPTTSEQGRTRSGATATTPRTVCAFFSCHHTGDGVDKDRARQARAC